MTKEYFNNHVKRCKKCGNIPQLVSETTLFAKSNESKYKIICWNCKWEDGEYKDNSRTGLCKTPESALRIWNNKFGRED